MNHATKPAFEDTEPLRFQAMHRQPQPWRVIGPKPSRAVITPAERVYGVMLAIAIGLAGAGSFFFYLSK